MLATIASRLTTKPFPLSDPSPVSLQLALQLKGESGRAPQPRIVGVHDAPAAKGLQGHDNGKSLKFVNFQIVVQLILVLVCLQIS